MNIKNLKPLSKRTMDEQRKIAIEGGLASGEARRNKRDLKHKYSVMFELLAAKSLKKASVEEKMLIEECGYEGYRLAKILESTKSSSKDIMKALELAGDRIEGKPVKPIDIKTEDKRFSSIKIINGEEVIELKLNIVS